MFTLKEIDNIHKRFGKQASGAEYLRALHSIGVIKQDSFIADGHSEYYNSEDQGLVGPPTHEGLKIANTTNEKSFNEHLENHTQGRINYLQMTKGLADSGIEKWTFNTVKMTITYIDSQGMAVLVEPIG
jgi:uncharacterized protein YbcV (DUF1398 family)